MNKILTLNDKWELIRLRLEDEGYSEARIEDAEDAFYYGVQAYISLLRDTRMTLTSQEMDRVVHDWEVEAYSHDYF
jgi:hypothetical protein